MGSRVTREAPKDIEKKRKKAAEENLSAADIAERSIRRAAGQKVDDIGRRYVDIVDATQDMEGLTYRPKTTETREVYELLLGAVHRNLGDQAEATIRSAADTVLEVLKSEDLKEFDRKKEVESIIGGLSNEGWSQMINLAKKITDYGEDQEGEGGDGDGTGGGVGRNLEGEDGVAVLFEDDDGEEEEEEEGFEVKDDDSEEEEEGLGEAGDEDEGSDDDEDKQDNMVVGGVSSSKSGKKSSDRVSPHEIDAFWLQRLITASYPDSIQSNDLTTKALELLSSDMDLRDLENSVADLFGYENFDLVATLTKNRDTIVWCTKLARSNDDEKKDVEVAMREKGVGWIIRSLAGDRADQGRKNADGDITMSHALNAVPTKATLAPGSVARPQRTVDIDSLIFQQGGHLMSNKKVKLPPGSFKRAGKGYEEIHVPEPEKRVAQPDDVVVYIAGLPQWTHPVWGKTERLNPVQSKVFPIAFQTDEPMLLCAPTGAGKVSLWLPGLSSEASKL
jgi:pre-mRNA-splicing helicase BRR2